MPHPLLGPDAVRRNVFVSPSRLARETELIDAVYALLEPHLDDFVDANQDLLDDAEIAEAVAAVHTVFAGGDADADTAHETLLWLATELNDTAEFENVAVARFAEITAAWLSIKVGRRLRVGDAEVLVDAQFGGPVNVLALPRLDADYRELLDAVAEALNGMELSKALDALQHPVEYVMGLVGTSIDNRPAPDALDLPLAEELHRLADWTGADAARLRQRWETLARSAADEGGLAANMVADGAETVAVWLRMRCGDTAPGDASRLLRWLVEQVVWLNVGRQPEAAMTVCLDPESDQLGVLWELRVLYRAVVDTADEHRPEVSQDAYIRRLESVVERLSGLPEQRRLAVLFDWISPLLDEVAWENGEFCDEPEMTTAEAVDRFRRIAAGEEDDLDAVHWHLTSFALVESEDQDPDMHVRSQAAFLAADWLCLKTGRTLRFDEELFGHHEPGDVPAIVNTLALTRSRQISYLPEDVDDAIADERDDEDGVEVLAGIIELRAMRDELVDQAAASLVLRAALRLAMTWSASP